MATNTSKRATDTQQSENTIATGVTVHLERSGHGAELILRPPVGKPPTLDEDVLARLESALDALEADPPRLLVLRSASERYFCVGANLKVLRATTEATIEPWVRAGHRVICRLEQLPCPTIARVRGYAMGGGLELAMGCDFIFAEENAQFAQSEAGLGFIPGWGGSLRLPERVGIAAAKRYFFTGRMIDASTALALGLADHIGTAAEIDAEIEAMTEEIVAQSAYALGAFKRILNEAQAESRERNVAAEVAFSKGCLRQADTRQRLDAFFAKKKDKTS